MDISFRSYLTVGVATITAAAVAFGPTVQEQTAMAPPARVVQVASPPVQLAADIQPLAAADLPNLLVGWLERIIVPPSAGQPFPTPHFPPVVAPTSVGSSIIWVYNAVEPWARYAADVAAYAVGWIPYVGWLAPQITIFYNFGERIARSITYNIAYWLDGNISFTQGLINVGIDTINSFIFLANDQLAFWLPPLPPIPPIFPFSTATATTATTAEVTTLAADATEVNAKHTAAVVDDETTDVVDKKADVDAVKEAKEPKEPKVPKKIDVSAQDEVRGAQDADTTESKKDSNDAGNGKATPKANGDTGKKVTKKNDDNGNKKKADKE